MVKFESFSSLRSKIWEKGILSFVGQVFLGLVEKGIIIQLPSYIFGIDHENTDGGLQDRVVFYFLISFELIMRDTHKGRSIGCRYVFSSYIVWIAHENTDGCLQDSDVIYFLILFE